MDFNNDTYLDLIVGEREGYINYFRRLPNGTLTEEPDIKSAFTTIDVGENSAPCTVDWNEDGLLDLVIGNDSPGNIRLYLNKGTPSVYSFGSYTMLECGGSTITYNRCNPHVVDLNEDGKKDLIIGEDLGWMYYMENVNTNADPVFDVVVKLESDGAPLKWPSGLTDTRGWVNDWNEDGVPDLLLGNYGKNLYIYLGINNETLIADGTTVPETGGSVAFTLAAGASNGNRNYLMLGSVTGTAPGTPLPGGFAVLPLNWDAFTDLALLLANSPVFSGFMGKLDTGGGATATLNVPPLAGYAGTVMYYAYCINNPFDFASNPVEIEIVP